MDTRKNAAINPATTKLVSHADALKLLEKGSKLLHAEQNAHTISAVRRTPRVKRRTILPSEKKDD
jgi:hypothetical protein